MNRHPPTWWQPVMKDLRDTIDTVSTGNEKRSATLFEMVRRVIADNIRADFIPRDMTEKQARHFVFEMALLLFEMVKSGDPLRHEFNERFVGLIDSVHVEEKMKS